MHVHDFFAHVPACKSVVHVAAHAKEVLKNAVESRAQAFDAAHLVRYTAAVNDAARVARMPAIAAQDSSPTSDQQKTRCVCGCAN